MYYVVSNLGSNLRHAALSVGGAKNDQMPNASNFPYKTIISLLSQLQVV